MHIDTTTKDDYLRLIEIWGVISSLPPRLSERRKCNHLKPLILEHYFDAVDLRVAKTKAAKSLALLAWQNKILKCFSYPQITETESQGTFAKNAINTQAQKSRRQ